MLYHGSMTNIEDTLNKIQESLKQIGHENPGLDVTLTKRPPTVELAPPTRNDYDGYVRKHNTYYLEKNMYTLHVTATSHKETDVRQTNIKIGVDHTEEDIYTLLSVSFAGSTRGVRDILGLDTNDILEILRKYFTWATTITIPSMSSH